MSQTLLGAQVPFVSIAEAGKILGVAEITIRRRLRSGEIKGHKRSTPQGYIWIVELSEEDLQRNHEHEEQNGEHRSDPTEVEATDEVGFLRQMVEYLKEELKSRELSWQQQFQAKDKQIEQLHVLLQQAQTALSAPREDHLHWWQRLWQRQRP
jgi:hypothetical protein